MSSIRDLNQPSCEFSSVFKVVRLHRLISAVTTLFLKCLAYGDQFLGA